jgi:sugar/nucleoside kinase (ribokinase family)
VTEALPAGVEVHNVPTSVPLTFRHEYVEGKRELYITAVAPTLDAVDLPPAWRSLDVVHFGPVAQEVSHGLIDACTNPLKGASVQGWMRSWDRKTGHVAPLPARDLLSWAPPVQCSILSEEDIGDRREVIDFLRRHHPIVVLTDGAHGATVFAGERVMRVPAVPVREVDANGAGDVFAAAYLIRYYETGDMIVAAQFAAAVASFHVEQVGIAGIPTREQAEARWRTYYGE